MSVIIYFIFKETLREFLSHMHKSSFLVRTRLKCSQEFGTKEADESLFKIVQKSIKAQTGKKAKNLQ